MIPLEPCWTVDDVEICDNCCEDALEGLPAEQVAMLKRWAARYLWRATGRQYGLCEVTYRPCRRDCGEYWGGLPFPTRVSGEWVNMTCGTCTNACGCDSISEIIIPNTHEILSITGIDGEPLDPAETAVVYDRRNIIRVDGEQWPACQNLSTPTGEPGAWSITVLQGKPIPDGGALVAGILACELAKACAGQECRLPKRVQTITRQGVTVGFQDDFAGLLDLHTGLWEVDAFIESARTVRWLQPSISSPDVHRPVVQTWPVL